MAAMVASNGGSELSNPVSSQEKSSRPKRKFRADPPVPDASESSFAENSFLEYEHFPKEPLSSAELEHHVNLCETCQTLASSLKEVMDIQDRCNTDWSGMTESQLEELLLSDLDVLYKNAIRTITSYGYKDTVAINALLATGCFYVCKDPVANIAQHALKFLASGETVNILERENVIDDLKRLQKRLLEQMINMLRQTRPLFSRGDAMWCLLIYDMNLSLACAADTDVTSHLRHDEAVSVPAAQSDTQSNSRISIIPDGHINVSNKLNLSSDNQNNNSGPSNLTLPFMKFSAPDDLPGQVSISNHGGDNPISLFKSQLVEATSFFMPKASVLQHKLNSNRKGVAGNSRSRYRSYRSGRNYRLRGARSTSRAIRNGSLGNLLFDKRNKSISAFSSTSLKTSSLEIDKTCGWKLSQVDITGNFLFTAGSSAPSSVDISSSTSSLPSVSDNMYLSLTTASINNATLKGSHTSEAASDGTFCELPYYPDVEKLFSEDMKEEMLLKLVICVRRMQNQVQDWTDWAQQKVMQAARRLNKDKVELQTLRQEKAESSRLRKEKQTLEESTMKKVSDMQNAWSKACVQIERANAAMSRLELENNKLRQELEGARLGATDMAASCRDASMREIMTLKKIQSWERQKAILNEENATEKREHLQLQKQLEQAKDFHIQSEAKLIQEEKAKEEAILLVDAERKRRQNIEASAKLEEDTIASKSKNDLRTYKDDIRRLENQIAELRLRDCTKLAALRWQTKSQSYVNGNQGSLNGDILRDRECVMCLSEEMSVVFLPCSHQVVCTKCNELHEKQGMKDCPSCRTPIQRRICVRTAYS